MKIGLMIAGGYVSAYVFSRALGEWVLVRGRGPKRLPESTVFASLVDPTPAQRYEYAMRVAQAEADELI